MKLNEVFDYLKYGELGNVNLGVPDVDSIVGEIKPEHYPKLIAHTNMALTALYTRFWLSSKEVIIQLVPHIQQYWLDRKYADTNELSSEPYRYIMDSVFDPFLGDVLKIEEIHNEGGEIVYLNDLTQPWSVFTPTYNSIQIPYPMWCNSLVVHYRANHPRIDLQTKDPAQVELQIPEGFLEPLLFYIAHRVFASMNVDNDGESNNYLQKYEMSCKGLETKGLHITPNYSNLQLDRNGWK